MNIQRVKRIIMVAVCLVALTALIAASRADQSESGRQRSHRYAGTGGRSRHNLPVADGRSTQLIGRVLESSPAIVDDTHRGVTSLTARSPHGSPGIEICADGTYWDLQHNDDGQKQVVTIGGDPNTAYVHFAWTHWDAYPALLDLYRYVNCQGYDPAFGLCLTDCGLEISGHPPDYAKARAGFATIDVMSDENAGLYFHQYNVANEDPASPHRYSSFAYDQGIPCFSLFAEYELPGSVEAEAIWPHGAILRLGTPANDIFHVASHTSGESLIEEGAIYYWQRIGTAGTWEGPVVIDDDVIALNHHVAANPVTGDVAIIYEKENLDGLAQVGYIESIISGTDWIADGELIFPDPITALPSYNYEQVTDYSDPRGRQAWLECTGEYDPNGVLHVVWIEQFYADYSSDCRLRHWSPLTGFTTMTQAIGWENLGEQGVRDLWLAYPQIGFGDGTTLCTDGPDNPGPAGTKSNLAYAYVTYEQYGGPSVLQAYEISHKGYQNLDFYIAVSNNGGLTWSSPVNLTNTDRTACYGAPTDPCDSERDPSIALTVNDAIHIMYILDEDAGDAVFGQGAWTHNSVMYYKIPGGTDAPILCPTIGPNFAARLTRQYRSCPYNASYSPPGMVAEELIVENLGTGPMSGTIEVVYPKDWLTIAPSGGYVIPAGSDQVSTVTMDAAAPSIQIGGEGLYQALISVTHNDPGQPSPWYAPVDFFVFNDFFCIEATVLKTYATATKGPFSGTLALEVGSTGGFGNRREVAAGLSRLDPATGDSSWSIYDGSLIIGVPPDPDTTVFRDLYGQGRFQPGFRALSNLTVDTSAYGTGHGEATASAIQTTTDSLIGVDVEYAFPQHADSAEFVIIRYAVYNRTDSLIPDVTIGVAVDFDVMPGTDVGDVQKDAWNTGHLSEDLNLVYQSGADTSGHVSVGQNTATRFSAGLSALQPDIAPRAWIAQNDPYLTTRPGRGFHEAYLYPEMQQLGWEILQPYDSINGENLHSVMIFDQNVDLDVGDTKYYFAALASDNQTVKSDVGLLQTIGKSWRYAFGWHQVVTTDSLPENTPKSYPYFAVGTHADGLGSGCCGCVVTKVSGDDELTVGGGESGGCEGTIEFSGGDPCGSPYTADFRVETPDCIGDKYTEDVTVTIVIPGDCPCACPYQGDYDKDGYITPLDLAVMIDILFAGRPDEQDPSCPSTRSDLDCDGYTTPLDLGVMIDFLFAGGAPPCDPCNP
jgi:hypothetical protein